jgi:hypothetical protein
LRRFSDAASWAGGVRPRRQLVSDVVMDVTIIPDT